MRIIGFENWQQYYLTANNSKNVWIFVQTHDDKDVYLEHYQDWLDFKDYCTQNKVTIKNIGLQYKSHLVKTYSGDADGVYVIRSVKGQMGGTSRDCHTIGIVYGNEVKKTMWLTPELLEDSSYVDTLENCFEEALIYNAKEHKSSRTI